MDIKEVKTNIEKFEKELQSMINDFEKKHPDFNVIINLSKLGITILGESEPIYNNTQVQVIAELKS